MSTRLRDPNHDGDTSDSIFENTIIAYVNDNGGLFQNVPGNPHTMNQPYAGSKGHTLEGGIRVPFFLKLPGVAPGVYDRPVSTFDLLPTLVNEAGGFVPQADAPGVDIVPYIHGDLGGDPHDYMFWRNRNVWAVRHGDFKYARPIEPDFKWPYLWDLSASIQETQAQNVMNAQPQVATDMERVFTKWEATLPKPLYGVLGTDDRNHFDHFVFRNDLAPTTVWSKSGGWLQFGTSINKTLLVDDAYANAVLEFTTRNDADYTASNDLVRMSGLTFMLNQMWLTGSFSGGLSRTATINGGPLNKTINGSNTTTPTSDLLFAKSLTGQLPRLQLDATSSGTSARFKFQVAHNLQLLDNLEITGNGTQDFVFSGRIRDYDEPRSIVKSGTSRITLSGASTFRGGLTINEGEVRVAGTGASIVGPSGIVIGSAGTLLLEQGTIDVPSLSIAAGGQFAFSGGRMSTLIVSGSLINDGGVFAPGSTVAPSAVLDAFTQHSGKLEIELGGTLAGVNFDTLDVAGAANLGGALEVKLVNDYTPAPGDEFRFLTAGSVTGAFGSLILPALPGDQRWAYQNTGTHVTLMFGLRGDYNQNGVVDVADYIVWRNELGQSMTIGAGADGNSDAHVTMDDYYLSRDHYGAFEVIPTGASLSVPEPYDEIPILVSVSTCVFRRARMRRNSVSLVSRGKRVYELRAQGPLPTQKESQCRSPVRPLRNGLS